MKFLGCHRNTCVSCSAARTQPSPRHISRARKKVICQHCRPTTEAPPTAEELAAAAAAADLAAEQARLRATLDPMHVEHPDFDDRFLKTNYDKDDSLSTASLASLASLASQPSSWLQLEQRQPSHLVRSRRSLSEAVTEAADEGEDVCGC